MAEKSSAAVPLVSVLFPVYNTAEQHLRQAIDSILAQTFADFELLIIDDASTNATVCQVVNSYDDPRIHYSVNETNLGISGTRNRLLDLARGKYVAIMDHDDISLPERFEKQVAFLNTHPDVGVVSCHVEIFGDKTGVERMPVDDAEIRIALVTNCALFHSAAMLRKSVLVDHGIRYEEPFSPAEDYALWCRLIPHTQFHNIPEILFRYRFHAANTSTVQRERIMRGGLAVQSMVQAEYPALHALHEALATHVTRMKLFGFIPFLKITRKGGRVTCSILGLPLYRTKTHSRFE